MEEITSEALLYVQPENNHTPQMVWTTETWGRHAGEERRVTLPVKQNKAARSWLAVQSCRGCR